MADEYDFTRGPGVFTLWPSSEETGGVYLREEGEGACPSPARAARAVRPGRAPQAFRAVRAPQAFRAVRAPQAPQAPQPPPKIPEGCVSYETVKLVLFFIAVTLMAVYLMIAGAEKRLELRLAQAAALLPRE